MSDSKRPCKDCKNSEVCDMIDRCVIHNPASPKMIHDDYKKIEGHRYTLAACPVCHAPGELWQFSESATVPRKLLVMCSHGDKIGPQTGIAYAGCPLYMPPDDFYRETERDAIRYWNEFSAATTALRMERESQAYTQFKLPPCFDPNRELAEGDKRLLAMIATAFGPDSPSMNDLIDLIEDARPELVDCEACKGSGSQGDGHGCTDCLGRGRIPK